MARNAGSSRPGHGVDVDADAVLARALEEEERAALLEEVMAVAVELQAAASPRNGPGAGAGSRVPGGVGRGPGRPGQAVPTGAAFPNRSSPRTPREEAQRGVDDGMQVRARCGRRCARCEDATLAATQPRVAGAAYALCVVCVMIDTAVRQDAQHVFLFVGVFMFIVGMGMTTLHSALRLRRDGRHRAQLQLTLTNRRRVWLPVDAESLELMTRDLRPEDYERLLELDDTSHRGAHQAEIDRLPTFVYSGLRSPGDGGRPSCAITTASLPPPTSATSATNVAGATAASPRTRSDAGPSSGGQGVDNGGGTCSICLDEYVPGDALRMLPCMHAFHAACIDTWLKQSVTCPCCKASIRDLAGPDEEGSASTLSPVAVAVASTSGRHHHRASDR